MLNIKSGALFLFAMIFSFGFGCNAEDTTQSEVKGYNEQWSEVKSQEGLCLDIPHWTQENGAQLKWWWCTGEAKQKWYKRDHRGGRYRLVSGYNNKAIDLQGGTDRVMQNDWVDNNNQSMGTNGFYQNGGMHGRTFGAWGSNICKSQGPGSWARHGCSGDDSIPEH